MSIFLCGIAPKRDLCMLATYALLLRTYRADIVQQRIYVTSLLIPDPDFCRCLHIHMRRAWCCTRCCSLQGKKGIEAIELIQASWPAADILLGNPEFEAWIRLNKIERCIRLSTTNYRRLSHAPDFTSA